MMRSFLVIERPNELKIQPNNNSSSRSILISSISWNHDSTIVVSSVVGEIEQNFSISNIQDIYKWELKYFHGKLASFDVGWMCMNVDRLYARLALYLILKLFSLLERREKPHTKGIYSAIFEITEKNHKINNFISLSVVFSLCLFLFVFHRSPATHFFTPFFFAHLFSYRWSIHILLLFILLSYSIYLVKKMHEQFHSLCSVVHAVLHLTLSMHVDENDRHTTHHNNEHRSLETLYIP